MKDDRKKHPHKSIVKGKIIHSKDRQRIKRGCLQKTVNDKYEKILNLISDHKMQMRTTVYALFAYWNGKFLKI